MFIPFFPTCLGRRQPTTRRAVRNWTLLSACVKQISEYEGKTKSLLEWIDRNPFHSVPPRSRRSTEGLRRRRQVPPSGKIQRGDRRLRSRYQSSTQERGSVPRPRLRVRQTRASGTCDERLQ